MCQKCKENKLYTGLLNLFSYRFNKFLHTFIHIKSLKIHVFIHQGYTLFSQVLAGFDTFRCDVEYLRHRLGKVCMEQCFLSMDPRILRICPLFASFWTSFHHTSKAKHRRPIFRDALAVSLTKWWNKGTCRNRNSYHNLRGFISRKSISLKR